MPGAVQSKRHSMQLRPCISLGDLAGLTGTRLHGGDPDHEVSEVSSLQAATSSSVAFYDSAAHTEALRNTAAGAVIMRPRNLELSPVAALLVDAPRLAHVKAMRCLYSCHSQDATAIAATAHVAPGASVAEDVAIGHGAVIEDGARVEPGACIGPSCFVAAGVVVGPGSRLVSGVSLLAGTTLGEGVVIWPGTVIGADGFGYVRDGEEILKIPHIGGVEIGNMVEIGAGCTVDCGTMDSTVIGDHVKLDDQVHVGHNVRIGSGTTICGGVRIGGTTTIGDYCVIGGGVALSDNISIADKVTIGAASALSCSVNVPGQCVGGFGLPRPWSEWRHELCISRGSLLKRIRALEERS